MSDTNALSVVLVALMKGIADREADPALWQSLTGIQARVRDYIAGLGLDLVHDRLVVLDDGDGAEELEAVDLATVAAGVEEEDPRRVVEGAGRSGPDPHVPGGDDPGDVVGGAGEEVPGGVGVDVVDPGVGGQHLGPGGLRPFIIRPGVRRPGVRGTSIRCPAVSGSAGAVRREPAAAARRQRSAGSPRV